MAKPLVAGLLVASFASSAYAAQPTPAEHATLTKLSAALKAQATQLRTQSRAKYAMATVSGHYLFGGMTLGKGDVRIRTNGMEYRSKLRSVRVKGGLGWGGTVGGESAIVVAKPGTPADQIVPKLTIGLDGSMTGVFGFGFRSFRGGGAHGDATSGGIGLGLTLMLEGGYTRVASLSSGQPIRALRLADGAAAHADRLLARGGADIYKEIGRLERFLDTVSKDNAAFLRTDGE